MLSNKVTAQNGTLFGKVVDSSGKVLPLCTVTIFNASDTVILTYRLTNESGEFKVPGLPLNQHLRTLITYSGFEPYRLDFTLKESVTSLQIGPIRMRTSINNLDEIVVLSERPPVVIKNDTIEFNASAFKTLPSSLLEDLLKKLPGIDIDESGNLLYNGRRVNRLLVDGKRFFGNDYKMATKNLPSNFIDKVQVTDDKEEMLGNIDGNLSNLGKVINVTLKSQIKKAVFGKGTVGAGTNSRYEIGGILNTFRDTLQISLIGFSNNINKSSFTLKDISNLGGFNRSGYGGMTFYSNSGREGMAVNGVSFGGTNSGLTKVVGGGLNLNHSPSKRFSFYSQYFYGNSRTNVEQQQNIQRFSDDTVFSTNNNSTAFIKGYAHTINTGVIWNPDSFTIFSGSAGYSYTDNSNNSFNNVLITNSKLGKLSATSGYNTSDAFNSTYNHSFSYTRRWESKTNRLLFITHQFSRSINPSQGITDNINEISVPSQSIVLFSQLRTTNTPAINGSFFSSFTNPLSNKLTIRFFQRLNYDKNTSQILTFQKPYGFSDFDSLVNSLSNTLLREHFTSSSSMSLIYKLNKVTFTVSPGLLSQWINNSFLSSGKLLKQNFHNVILNSNINWKQLNIGYTNSVTPPSIGYLNPVPDNTNPLLINSGNPNLNPTKKQQFDFFLNVFRQKNALNYLISGSAMFYDNYIIQAVSLQNNGVQILSPVNVSGVYNASLNFRITKQYKKSNKFNLTAEVGSTFTLQGLPVLYNSIEASSITSGAGLTSRLSLSIAEILEISARYNPTFTKSTYNNAYFSRADITNHNLQGEVIVRFPKRIVWESNFQFRKLSNVPIGFPNSNLNWNSAITFLLFKEDKGQLKLAVYDLLNQNNAIQNYVSGNAIINNNTNVLKRYLMLTFTYNIKNLAGSKSKVGGKQSIFLF